MDRCHTPRSCRGRQTHPRPQYSLESTSRYHWFGLRRRSHNHRSRWDRWQSRRNQGGTQDPMERRCCRYLGHHRRPRMHLRLRYRRARRRSLRGTASHRDRRDCHWWGRCHRRHTHLRSSRHRGRCYNLVHRALDRLDPRHTHRRHQGTPRFRLWRADLHCNR